MDRSTRNVFQSKFRTYWDSISMLCIIYVILFTPMQVWLRDIRVTERLRVDSEGGSV